MTTQPAFEKFKLVELEVPPSKLEFVEGFMFEFELRRRMIQELGSSLEGSRDPTTQTSTPKSVEEVVAKVMKADKVTKLSQTMVIVNMKIGNLTLEVNTMKNRLATWEKEKVMLQEELDEEKDFQKGYKHNVEIWKKNRAEDEWKNKMFIKKL